MQNEDLDNAKSLAGELYANETKLSQYVQDTLSTFIVMSAMPGVIDLDWDAPVEKLWMTGRMHYCFGRLSEPPPRRKPILGFDDALNETHRFQEFVKNKEILTKDELLKEIKESAKSGVMASLPNADRKVYEINRKRRLMLSRIRSLCDTAEVFDSPEEFRIAVREIRSICLADSPFDLS